MRIAPHIDAYFDTHRQRIREIIIECQTLADESGDYGDVVGWIEDSPNSTRNESVGFVV